MQQLPIYHFTLRQFLRVGGGRMAAWHFYFQKLHRIYSICHKNLRSIGVACIVVLRKNRTWLFKSKVSTACHFHVMWFRALKLCAFEAFFEIPIQIIKKNNGRIFRASVVMVKHWTPAGDMKNHIGIWRILIFFGHFCNMIFLQNTATSQTKIRLHRICLDSEIQPLVINRFNLGHPVVLYIWDVFVRLF